MASRMGARSLSYFPPDTLSSRSSMGRTLPSKPVAFRVSSREASTITAAGSRTSRILRILSAGCSGLIET